MKPMTAFLVWVYSWWLPFTFGAMFLRWFTDLRAPERFLVSGSAATWLFCGLLAYGFLTAESWPNSLGFRLASFIGGPFWLVCAILDDCHKEGWRLMASRAVIIHQHAALPSLQFVHSHYNHNQQHEMRVYRDAGNSCYVIVLDEVERVIITDHELAQRGWIGPPPSHSLMDIEVPKPIHERTDPIYGWRAWLLDISLDGAYLKSLNRFGFVEQRWPEKEQVAICTRESGHYSAAPIDGINGPASKARAHLEMNQCQCGIYTLKSLQDLALAVNWIYGFVSLHGIVLEAEEGYRAEKVQVERLWLLVNIGGSISMAEAVAANLRLRYQCQVVVMEQSRFFELRDGGYLEATI